MGAASRRGDDPIAAVLRALKVNAWATVALYIVLGVIVAVFYLNAHSTSEHLKASVRQNETARIGLCALRRDLQTRVASSAQFLAEHPSGIPGVPASVIRDGIRNQTQTLKALDVVKC